MQILFIKVRFCVCRLDNITIAKIASRRGLTPIDATGGSQLRWLVASLSTPLDAQSLRGVAWMVFQPVVLLGPPEIHWSRVPLTASSWGPQAPEHY
jgi:hypothetical protein